jgi:hypothetical protein
MLLPDNLKVQPMSLWFASLIFLSWITLIPIINKLYIIITYFNQDIIDNIYETLTATKKRYKFCYLIISSIAIYFFIMIGPFFNSCGIYKEYELACLSVQFIACSVFIGFCILGFAMIGCIIFITVLCTFGLGHRSDGPIFTDHVMTSTTQFLEQYLPIDHPEQSDRCFICLGTPEEDNEKEWTILKCEHRSHRECLAEWYRYEQSCPYCRQIIEVSN